MGLGSAYIDGLGYCTGEFVILMDADLSHHVTLKFKLIAQIHPRIHFASESNKLWRSDRHPLPARRWCIWVGPQPQTHLPCSQLHRCLSAQPSSFRPHRIVQTLQEVSAWPNHALGEEQRLCVLDWNYREGVVFGIYHWGDPHYLCWQNIRRVEVGCEWDCWLLERHCRLVFGCVNTHNSILNY